MTEESDVSMACYKFEAVKLKFLQNRDGYVLNLAIHPNEVPEELLRDWVGSRYMVAMVKLNDQDEPVIPQSVEEAKRARTSAVMLCKDDKFWMFMGTKVPPMAPIFSEEECIAALKTWLGIDSRSEIAKDKEVTKAFIELRKEFMEG